MHEADVFLLSKDIAATASTNETSVDTNSTDIARSRSLKPPFFKDRGLANYEKSVYNEGGVVESRGGRLPVVMWF